MQSLFEEEKLIDEARVGAADSSALLDERLRLLVGPILLPHEVTHHDSRRPFLVFVRLALFYGLKKE